MSSDDDKDQYEIEELRSLGFSDVDWEDSGAWKTIFDDFDTLEHFSQVADFRRSISPFLPSGEDDAYELVMVLEDLNPQLFNALGSAVSALNAAVHEDHVAQAMISGRRYMERLADALFPPRKELVEGRQVDRPQYRNRIWAFISVNLESDPLQKDELGREVDRLIDLFNAGLHDVITKEEALKGLVDVSILTASLLLLNPATSRQPYRPFQERIFEFFREVVSSPD